MDNDRSLRFKRTAAFVCGIVQLVLAAIMFVQLVYEACNLHITLSVMSGFSSMLQICAGALSIEYWRSARIPVVLAALVFSVVSSVTTFHLLWMYGVFVESVKTSHLGMGFMISMSVASMAAGIVQAGLACALACPCCPGNLKTLPNGIQMTGSEAML